MIHVLETIQTSDGAYVHTCKVCGSSVETKKKNWVGVCKGSAKQQEALKQEKLKSFGMDKPCIHLGEATNQSVKACGCHTPAWQKQLHHCTLLNEPCVLLQLKKKPSLLNCQTCDYRERQE